MPDHDPLACLSTAQAAKLLGCDVGHVLDLIYAGVLRAKSISSDWAVMFIVARGGRTYVQLRFGAGPGRELVLPVEVDFEQPFAASDWLAWDQEYLAAVQLDQPPPAPRRVVDPLEAEWAERWGRDDPLWEDASYHSSLEMFDERL